MNKNKEIRDALNAYKKEKNIPPEKVAEKLCSAIEAQARTMYNCANAECKLDLATGNISLVMKKTCVEAVENEKSEILVEDARLLYKHDAVVGDEVSIPLDINNFGRIQASSVKTTIRSGIKEIEKELLLETANSQDTESLKAHVIMVDPKTGDATVRINQIDISLPKSEQIPGETLKIDDDIDVYIAKLSLDKTGENKGNDNFRVIISRTNPGLVKRLFEKEVVEIFDGHVVIKSIAREAGTRTKIAVTSNNANIDPVGACIGEKGARINGIKSKLNGEQIDVIKYSEDPREFIKEALSPAVPINVEIIDPIRKTSRVLVREDELSLAIGNKGQNARLAAKLTGWKIDIKQWEGKDIPVYMG